MYFLVFITLLDGKSRALLALVFWHPLAGSLWAIAAGKCVWGSCDLRSSC